VRQVDESEYREFVVARMSALRRTAYLLCRDWHGADDLVATALDKLYRRWPRRAEIGDLDAYVRVVLTRAWVDETRRRGGASTPTATRARLSNRTPAGPRTASPTGSPWMPISAGSTHATGRC
jgi:DNA-directed RNA polymerase specialized sigma24 family protein